MTNKTQNIFEMYANKKVEAEKIDKEIAELRDLIIGFMQQADIATHETTFGRFQLQGRASWTYSDAIAKAQEFVKTLKKQEEESGAAKSMTLPVLVFKNK